MLESVLHLLNQPWLPWLFGLFILIWGGVQWLVFSMGYLRPVAQGLTSAIRALESRADALAFAADFRAIDGLLGGNPVTARAWVAFRQTLLVGEGVRVRGLRVPQDYFHFETVVEEQLDLRFYRALPATFAGAGLLATFGALVAAFYFTARGLAGGDPLQSRNALLGLLNTASAKFFASFAGIVTALVFSWGERLLSRRCQRRVGRLARLLEERIELVMPETGLLGLTGGTDAGGEALWRRIAAHLDNSMAGLRDKTIQAVRGVVDPLAAGLQADHLSAAARDALTPVIVFLREETARLAREQADMLRDSLGAVTQALDAGSTRDEVAESVRAEGERLAELQERVVRDSLGEMTRQLRELFSLDQMAERFREEGERISATQARVLADIRPAEAAPDGAFLEPLLEALRTEGERLTRTNQQVIQDILGETTAHLGGLTAQNDRLERTATRLERHGDALEEQTVRIARTMVDGELAPLHQATRRLEQSAAALEQRVARDDRDTLDHINAVVQTAGERITRDLTRELRESALLQPVLEAVRDQGVHLAESQSRALAEALAAVAVRGVDQGVVLDPVVAAVRSEGERLLARQGEALRHALEDLGADLRRSLAPAGVVETVRAEAAGLARRLEELVGAGRFDAEPVLAVLRAATADLGRRLEARLGVLEEGLQATLASLEERGLQLAEGQTRVVRDGLAALAGRSNGASGTPGLDEILTACRTVGRELLQRQEAVLSQVLERHLAAMPAGSGALESLRTEAAGLVERLERVRFDPQPLLAALERHGRALAAHRLPEMRAALEPLLQQTDPAPTAGDSQIFPAIEDCHDIPAAMTLEPLLAALQGEGERLLARQGENIRQALAGLSDQVRAAAGGAGLLATLREEIAALARLVTERLTLGSTLQSPLVDELRAEISAWEQRLDQSLAGVGRDCLPLLEALRAQVDGLVQHQVRAVHEALATVAVRREDGALAVEPLLAAVAAQGERQLERQQRQLQDILADWSARQPVAPDLDRLTTPLRAGLAALEERLTVLEPVMLALGPALSDLEARGGQLATNQAQAIKEALEGLTLRAAGETPAVEPLLVAVRVEGERLLERQQATLQQLLDPLIFRLEQTPAPREPLAVVRDEAGPWLERLEGMLADRLPDPRPLLEQLRREVGLLAERLEQALEPRPLEPRGELSLEPVLTALEQQGSRLAESQHLALSRALAAVAVREPGSAVAIDPLLAAVRSEGERLLAGQEAAVRRVLEDVEQRLAGLDPGDRIVAAVEQRLAGLDPGDRIVAAVEQGTRQVIDALTHRAVAAGLSLEPVLGALREAVATLSLRWEAGLAQWGDQLLEPLMRAMAEQGRTLREQQALVVREALAEVAVAGSDGRPTLEPVLAAVSATGERLLERQGVALREALEAATDRLRDLLAPERIVAQVGVETRRLVEELEERLTAERIDLDPWLEALHEATTNLAERLETALGPAGFTLEPVLTALDHQGRRLAEDQSRALRDVLESITVREDTGSLAIDPLLAAVRAGSERLLAAQTDAMRVALDQALQRLTSMDGGGLPPPSTDGSRSVTPTVASMDGGGLPSPSTPTVASMEGGNLPPPSEWAVAQVVGRLEEAIGQLTRRLETELAGGRFTLEDVAAVFRAEVAAWTAPASAPDLEPVLAAIQAQGERLAHGQSQTLREVLEGVAVRGPEEGGLSLDPLLAAVQLQGERLLERQEALVRSALERVPVVAPASDAEGAGLLQPLLAAVQAQGERLLERQASALEAIERRMDRPAPAGDDGRLERLLEGGFETLSARMAQRLEQVVSPVEPLLAALREEGQRLAESQARLLRETLETVALRHHEGAAGVTLEPVLAALRLQGERLLDEQAGAVRESLAGLRLALGEALNPQGLGTVVRGELDRLVQALDQSRTTLEATLEPRLREIGAEVRELARQVSLPEWQDDGADDGADPERVLAAFQAAGSRLLEQHQAALTAAVQELTVRIRESLPSDGPLAGLQSEIARLGQRLTEGTGGDGVILAPLVNSLSRETRELAARLEATLAQALAPLADTMDILRAGQDRLVQEQSRQLRDLLAQVAVTDTGGQPVLEPVLAAVKMQYQSLLEDQEAALRRGLEQGLGTLRDSLAPERMAALLEDGITRLSRRLEERLQAGEVYWQSVVDSLRGATGAIDRTGSFLAGQDLDQAVALLREHAEGLAARQERADLLNEARLATVLPGVGEVDPQRLLTPLLEALRGEGQRLAREQRESMQEALAELVTRMDGVHHPETILAALRAETARLAEMFQQSGSRPAPDTAPLLAALESLGQRLLDGQRRAMADALETVAVRDGAGSLALDPALAAATASGERLLAQQAQAMKTLLDGAVADLREALAPESIVGAMTAEIDRLLVHLEERQLTAEQIAQPVVQAFRAEVVALHQSLGEAFDNALARPVQGVGLGEGILAPVLDAIRTGGDRILEQLASGGLPAGGGFRAVHDPREDRLPSFMGPVMEAVNQFQTLADTLGSVAARYAHSLVDLQPVIAAVREEGERLTDALTRQLGGEDLVLSLRSHLDEKFLEQAAILSGSLSGLAAAGSASLPVLQDGLASLRDTLVEVVQARVGELADTLAALPDAVAIQEAVRAETDRLADGVRSQPEEVIRALRAEHAALEQTLLAGPLAELPDAAFIRDVVREQGDRLVAELQAGQVSDDVIRAVREESAALERRLLERPLAEGPDLEAIRDVVRQENDRLAEGWRAGLESRPLPETPEGRPAGGDLTREELERALDEQAARLERKLSQPPVAADTLTAALRAEGERLAVTLAGQGDSARVVETVLEEGRRLLSRLERLPSREVLVETVEAGVERLAIKLDSRPTLDDIAALHETRGQVLLAEIERRISWEPVIAALREESRRLARRFRAGAMTEEVTGLVRQEGAELALRLDGVEAMERLAEVVQTESSRLVAELGARLPLDPVLAVLREEMERLGRTLLPSGFREELLESVRRQGVLLAERLDRQPTLADLEELTRRQGDRLAERLRGLLSLDSLLAAVKQEVAGLAAALDTRRLETLLRDALTDLAQGTGQREAALERTLNGMARALDGAVTSETLLQALQGEGERLTAAIERVIHSALAVMADWLPEGVSKDAIGEALHSEARLLEHSLEQAVRSAVGEVSRQLREELDAGRETQAAGLEPETGREIRDSLAEMSQLLRALHAAREQWGVQEEPETTATRVVPKGPEIPANATLLDLFRGLRIYATEQFSSHCHPLTSVLEELEGLLERQVSVVDGRVVERLWSLVERAATFVEVVDYDFALLLGMDRWFWALANTLTATVEELLGGRPWEQPEPESVVPLERSTPLPESVAPEQESVAPPAAADAETLVWRPVEITPPEAEPDRTGGGFPEILTEPAPERSEGPANPWSAPADDAFSLVDGVGIAPSVSPATGDEAAEAEAEWVLHLAPPEPVEEVADAPEPASEDLDEEPPVAFELTLAPLPPVHTAAELLETVAEESAGPALEDWWDESLLETLTGLLEYLEYQIGDISIILTSPLARVVQELRQGAAVTDRQVVERLWELAERFAAFIEHNPVGQEKLMGLDDWLMRTATALEKRVVEAEGEAPAAPQQPLAIPVQQSRSRDRRAVFDQFVQWWVDHDRRQWVQDMGDLSSPAQRPLATPAPRPALSIWGEQETPEPTAVVAPRPQPQPQEPEPQPAAPSALPLARPGRPRPLPADPTAIWNPSSEEVKSTLDIEWRSASAQELYVAFLDGPGAPRGRRPTKPGRGGPS
ncbi:MAG: hypothetical protein HQL82_00140 [Magnetococcales bacterium]|nr:hypothetical protein [Magnetococcales bacterium]